MVVKNSEFTYLKINRKIITGFYVIVFILFCNKIWAQSSTYLKFATSTGTGYNIGTGTAAYIHPIGQGMTSTTSNSAIVPIAARPYGNFINTFLPSSISQSSVGSWNTLGGASYEARLEDLYDNDYTTGAQTMNLSDLNSITIDLGQSTFVGSIQVAAITAANLNGALLQYSTDNVNWTSVVQSSNGLPLTGISGATNTSLLTINFVAVSARYFRFSKINDRVDLSEFRILPIVSQSSGTVLGTNINLNDNSVAAAATTLGTLADEFVMIDLGATRSFSNVKLATAVAANLDGSNLQVSNDAQTWTTLTITNTATGISGSTISGSSIVYPITFTFSSQSARYVRVRKAAAIVNVSEFQIGAEVFASLALSGTKTTLNDGSYTTGVTTTATAGIAQWVAVNLGTPKTFSHILLSTITATANLDGSSIQTSMDGINWTTQISSISGSSTNTLVPYFFANAVTAQYVRVLKGTSGSTLAISEFIVSPAITLSTGAKPVLSNYGNLYDNTVAAATTTLSGTNQYVMLDLGISKTFSSVQIAAATNVANLDGASLQVSTDAINWTSLSFANMATNTTATTFSGSSIVYPITYTFASQTARYIRVFRAASGVVSLSEFRVSPGVFQSSATSLANNAIPSTLNDNSTSTGALSNSGTTPFVALNFESPKTFSNVELAPHTAITNLNGATLQTSNDGVTWTSISSVLDITTNTPSSTIVNAVLNTRRTYSFASQTAQYIRLIKLDGTAIGVSEFKVGLTISQSSGTSIGTVSNLSDNAVTTAAVTAIGLNQWVMRDLGSVQPVNFVELATSGSVANMDGAVLQSSTDGVNWTTLTTKNNRTGVSGTAISGSSLTYPDIFSFTTTNARYFRVFRAASGTVAVSEFQVSTAVFQSSGTSYATTSNLYDGALTTTAGLTSVGTALAPAYIGLNLGSSRTISTVEIATTNTAQLNTATLEYSNDFLTWTPLIASLSNLTANQSNTLSFSPVSARYIRVRSNAIAINLSEFKVLADSISTVKILNPALTSSVSAVLPIGFDFKFKDVAYSNFSVSTEGLLRLGTVAVTTESLNNTVSIANNPILFAQWNDLATGDAASNGGVTKTIIGTSPNRKMILEWRARNATTTGATDLVYQIALHETSNKIEYIYINGANNTTDASIGVAVGSVADVTRKFYSVTPNAVLANTTYSNMKPNDFVRLWPGNGTIYTFTPTILPTTATIPTDFASLDNAMGAVNWTGTPNTGGYTVTINGNYAETAPNAYATTPTGTTWIKLPGFLLTANGTSAKSIVFKWSGSGTKPIFRNGQGVGNVDYIIGLSGSDYVTFDGLSLLDTTNHTSAFTSAQHTAANNLHAEMGFALFKQRFSTSLGNNGCNNVTIKNCTIDLSRWPNTSVSFSSVVNTYTYRGTRKTNFSRAIYATRYTHLEQGQLIGNVLSQIGYNANQGILTQNDVHWNITVTSNTINDVSIGIEFDDAWKQSGSNFFAGTNNIIGASGAGNTITNFGPQPNASNSTAYNYMTNTADGTTETSISDGSYMAGIALGGQKDYSVEYNVINTAIDESGTTTAPTTATSFIQNLAGIIIGKTGLNQNYPIHATGFFKKINYNTISNINTTTTTASNQKSVYGILDLCGSANATYNSSTITASNGNVDINNNTIFNLTSRAGNVRGISTSFPFRNYGDIFYNVLGSSQKEQDQFATNGTVNIKNNTITQLAQLGNNSYNNATLGNVLAIYYGAAAKNLFIENNIIGGVGNDGIVVGSANNSTASTNNFINAQGIGVRGILVDRKSSLISPLLISIKNNTITNIDRYAGTITSYLNQRSAGASAITIFNGATTNIIENNIITGMDIANGLYNNAANTGLEIIHAFGRPKSGTSTMTVKNNSITAITRNQFGFLTSMASGSGLNASTIGIRANYTSLNQNKIISGNTINGITQTATYTTTAAQQYTYYSRLIGIDATGRDAVGDQTNIFDNVITNLEGANWNQGGTLTTSSYSNPYSVTGINARNGQFINVYNNRVCGLSTTLTGSTATDYTANIRGIAGISVGKSGTGGTATKTTLGESIYNNFVSELTAPNISEELAIEGIVYWGYGRFAKIAHNTIALGNPEGGASGRLSTSGNTFGVNGVSLNNYYFNTAAYPVIFRNNIISINATAKGSTGATAYSGTTTGGFNTAWRTPHTTVKKKPLGIDNSSGGNVYFINDDVRNYIYGQGIVSTQSRYYTSGLRNAYGYFKNAAPASYQNTTNNLVNDTISAGKYFNVLCGKYKSFWGSPERTSFIDIDASNNWLPIPFVNSGATCADKLKIASTASSYVVMAAKLMTSPLSIATDFFGTNRNTTSATSGAHAAPAGATGSNSDVIDFDYTPICDGVCEGTKTLEVKITPPIGKSIPTNLSDAEIPRVYYRRIYNNSAYTSVTALSPVTTSAIVDNNWFYRDGLNNSAGPSGWRFAKASSVNGNNYTFNLHDTVFSGSNVANQVVPSYTIEYFVMARTTDGTIVNWSSGDLSFSCPTSVIMNNTTTGTTAVIGPYDDDALPSAYNTTTPSSSAVNHGTGAVDGNSVADRFTIYKGADLTRNLYVGNNGVTYSTSSTTNPTTASVTIPICTNEVVSLGASYFITATGEKFEDSCIIYKMQVANDVAFTSGVQTFSQSDTNFQYTMTTVGTKYFRVWLDCNGSNAVNTNTSIIAFTASDCPTNTSPAVASSTSCIGTPKSITVSSSTPTVSKNYWVVNPYGKIYTVPPVATTALSTNISISPNSTAEAGIWSRYVTNATGNTVTDQIVKSASYYDASVPTYFTNGSDAIIGKGTVFTTTKFIKLNGISVIGATGDGTASSGYKISLYDTTGNNLIYSATGTSVGDNAVAQTTLTNWFIAPGTYILALDETTVGAGITGALGSVAISAPLAQPNTPTPNIIIQGGVESKNDLSSIDSSIANYFVDWDFTEYCTSTKDTFGLYIIPTSCCTVPVLPTMTITTDSAVNTCGIIKYTVTFSNTTGAAVNNIKFSTDLKPGQFLVDSSIIGTSVFGTKATIIPNIYINEPNFVLDTMTIPVGTSSFSFQVDVKTKALNPFNIFTIENDCPTSKTSVIYPRQTCDTCFGGSALLAHGDAWQAGGLTARNSNTVSNIPIGNPISGPLKADITLTYSSPTPTFEYLPSSFPRKNGTYVQLSRYDNRTGSTGNVLYKVDIKDSANKAIATKPSFKIAGIGKYNGQADVITVFGVCGADTFKATLDYGSTNTTRNTYSIVENVATASGYYYTTPNDFNSMYVSFERSVSSIFIVWNMNRTPARRVFKSIYISDIKFACNKEPEPVEDNVYVETSIFDDSLATCNDATIRMKISNLNCETQTIDLFNKLPNGLKYVDTSYVGLGSEMPDYAFDSFYLKNLNVPSGISNIYIKVRPTNPAVSATYNLNYKYTVLGGSNNPNPYSSYAVSGKDSNVDSKIVYYSSSPTVLPLLNLAVIGCLDTIYNGSVITYQVTLTNNTSATISNFSIEDILDSNQLMIPNSLTMNGFNAGWTANRYDTLNFLTIDNLSIPANSSATISYKINTQDIKTEFLNAVSLYANPSDECAISSVVNSNYERIKYCTVNCILVNPRITYRHRKE